MPRRHRAAGDRWSVAVALLLLCLAGAFATSSRASASTEVDLCLVLAMDASGSVSPDRFELQRSGYSAAFRHPLVLKAIRSGLNGAIAVTVMQWTGPALQVQAVPWTLIGDEGAMLAFADAIDATPRQLFGGGTSISGAIDRGVILLNACPFLAGRRVIDISGDGGNNRGRPAGEARDEAVASGIVINGLPILELDPRLDEHYLRNVIGGPNAFMVPAQTFAEFADAIRKKLITEIAALPHDETQTASEPRKACETC